MNKHYAKGYKKERSFVLKARNEGKIAFRSAGSHSPIDVCIIDLKARSIAFLQCKPESMSENKKKELEEQLSGLNGGFSCSFKVV